MTLGLNLVALGALLFAGGFLAGAMMIGLLAWRLARRRRQHANHRYLEIL